MNRSSHIKDASYDDDSRRLSITFRNGRTYEYDNVPKDFHNGLNEAPSPGRFFHRQILPRFTGRLVKHNGE